MEDMAMRNFDPTPLWRSTVGFDRLFDLIDDVPQLTGEDNYPPYNIERTSEDAYRTGLSSNGLDISQVGPGDHYHARNGLAMHELANELFLFVAYRFRWQLR
jgi:hypothetical protein